MKSKKFSFCGKMIFLTTGEWMIIVLLSVCCLQFTRKKNRYLRAAAAVCGIFLHWFYSSVRAASDFRHTQRSAIYISLSKFPEQ